MTKSKALITIAIFNISLFGFYAIKWFMTISDKIGQNF